MSVLTGPHTILLLPLTRQGKGSCSTTRTHCSLERPPESVSLAYGLGGNNPAQVHWPCFTKLSLRSRGNAVFLQWEQ